MFLGKSPHPLPTQKGERAVKILTIALYDVFYQQVVRPAIFASGTPQETHEKILEWLRWCDSHYELQPYFERIYELTMPYEPIEIGGVALDYPLMLAAGFIKGMGFEDESSALQAVRTGQNIIPGWRTMPSLVGQVELGSFTRWPRMGNEGTVIWRDEATHSTQNRVGLKNPGALAASEFLRLHTPKNKFGINVAVSPGVADVGQEKQEILESLAMLHQISPAWFTLNLSCPNTEDDPSGNQTEEKAQILCGAAVEFLGNVPLWVKVSPNLADEQTQKLMRVFAEVGVRAVIATNTLAQPSPENPNLMAGVGGGRLHTHAVRVAGKFMAEKKRHGYAVDVIGCGGVWNKNTYSDFVRVGVPVVQYWSALVYRGLLAAAVIR